MGKEETNTEKLAMRSGCFSDVGSHERPQMLITLIYLIEIDAIDHVTTKPALPYL